MLQFGGCIKDIENMQQEGNVKTLSSSEATRLNKRRQSSLGVRSVSWDRKSKNTILTDDTQDVKI